MYLKGIVTKDALKDWIIYCIAIFDTKDGDFESLYRSDWVEINVPGLLSDLSDEERDNEISN